MNEPRRILIPSAPSGSAAERAFLNAGFDLDFGFTTEELAEILASPDREARLEAALENVFDQHLGTAHGLQALGPHGHIAVTADVLDRAPHLDVVFIGAAGYDRIDIAAATERGILVVNAPGGNAIGVAEHALGLMLALTHKIAFADRLAHVTERWTQRTLVKSTAPALTVLSGTVLGLVGCGHIGAEVARLGHAFGMRVQAFDPYMDPEAAQRLGISLTESLADLLRSSDQISLHVPLTEDTRNLIGEREFALMQSHACVINTSRGEILDTDALTHALTEGIIGGAGLDVTNPEPLPTEHPLFRLDNVILTPHIGGASPEMLAQSAVTAANLAVEILRGEPPRAVINPEAQELFFARRRSQEPAAGISESPREENEHDRSDG